MREVVNWKGVRYVRETELESLRTRLARLEEALRSIANDRCECSWATSVPSLWCAPCTARAALAGEAVSDLTEILRVENCALRERIVRLEEALREIAAEAACACASDWVAHKDKRCARSIAYAALAGEGK